MDLRPKCIFVLLFLGFAFSVYVSRVSYFAAVAFYTLLLAGLAYTSPNDEFGIGIFLTGLTGLRTFIYLIIPSMVGPDPDKVASGVAHVSHFHSNSAISGLSFYRWASGLHWAGAINHYVVGPLGPHPWRLALVFIPISLTIVSGLAAFALSRRLGYRGLAAGILTPTGGMVAAWSLQPVPQTLAVITLASIVLLVVIFLQATTSPHLVGPPQKRWIQVTILLLSASLLLTHKLPLFVITLYFAAAAILTRSPQRMSHMQIALVLGIMTAVQWFWATDFAWAAVRKLIAFFLSAGITTASQFDTPASTVVLGGITGVLIRNLHWLALSGFAGFGWLLLINDRRKGNTSDSAMYVAGIGTAGAALAAMSVVAPGFSYSRTIMVVTLPLALLAGITVERTGNISAGAAIGLIAFLLVAQVGAPFATPDHPLKVRYHLTDEEMTAKQTIDGVTETIYTDDYYARELSEITHETTYNTGTVGAYQEGWNPLGEALYTYNLTSVNHPIVIRDTRYLRLHGTQRLDYDPDDQLQAERSLVYKSRNVKMYSRSNKNS
ncbi:hypothetical protein ACERIM_16645 [Natrinema sp. H-ect1]|uniref:hypothetical protein n=1 Tax=Natrinema sp. H-ect1 TaxID=3242700 RepID=UPI00359DDE81